MSLTTMMFILPAMSRSKKHAIVWYVIVAVCVFPLLGAHVHAFNPHHVASPHPLEPGLHSHQYASHDGIDINVAQNTDDYAVDLGGESVLQQVLKILQHAVLLAWLPVALAVLRFRYPSASLAPIVPRPPRLRQCQPRAPPVIHP